MKSNLLAVVVAVQTAPCLLAQGLRTVDTVPYGPAPTELHSQDGGAVWSGGWLGVDSQHPVAIASWWAFENNVADSGPFLSDGLAVGTTFSTDVPAAITAWSASSLSLAGANQDYIDLDAHISKYRDLNHGSIAVWLKSVS